MRNADQRIALQPLLGSEQLVERHDVLRVKSVMYEADGCAGAPEPHFPACRPQ